MSQAVHADMKIGEVIERFPKAQEVIKKYFGNGCFTCPGVKMETLAFGALMHGIDVKVIVDELNGAINKDQAH